MKVIDEVTMYDDWSIWEACRMDQLKGHELTVYGVFAKAFAQRMLMAKTSVNRSFSANHQIINIVKATSLSQTQVRYAMKKLIAKGMVTIKNKGGRPEYYNSVVDTKMTAVYYLVKKSADAEVKWKDLPNGKQSIIARITAAEKKLRKARKSIEACGTFLELNEWDKDARSMIGYDNNY